MLNDPVNKTVREQDQMKSGIRARICSDIIIDRSSFCVTLVLADKARLGIESGKA
jgi:hypothetical protein